MRNDYPICLENHRNCFAYANGGCQALRKTDFNRPCPFFKTAEQAAEEEKKIKTRLSAIGMYKRGR